MEMILKPIDYRSLIHIIGELCGRIEQLEKVNKENLSLLNLVEKGLNE
jgi:YesN/AraC family two-component response regulator